MAVDFQYMLVVGLRSIVVVEGRPCLLGGFAGRRLTEWFPADVVDGRPCLSIVLLGVGSRIGFRPSVSVVLSLGSSIVGSRAIVRSASSCRTGRWLSSVFFRPSMSVLEMLKVEEEVIILRNVAGIYTRWDLSIWLLIDRGHISFFLLSLLGFW
jgi:hypothetical protein